MRYIELNPVRAGIIETPANYLYSSYHANALSCQDVLITPHAEFLKLSDDSVTRQAFYAELCQQEDVQRYKVSLLIKKSFDPFLSCNIYSAPSPVLVGEVLHV